MVVQGVDKGENERGEGKGIWMELGVFRDCRGAVWILGNFLS
jgi:hypothetical protein